ncbi:hypothetical protein VSR01_10830 [Actinacidiphila sp. DG2A-62]|uniref:hypothetical protein n=1 Tax=Actinacidiphila sp. DG2A-62 TaxID=3108821 RepID=UPI002DB80F12|nr:hypothetical protein [Actinacidiphila sp. DG2A-62]MEC3994013.1 hypothetical protein [Actinacidiphila sp. DG2A-62]
MRALDRLIAAGEDHQKSPQRAFRLPPLRPYLPGRAHVRRVLGGLAVLAKMAGTASRAGLRKAIAPPEPKQAKAPEKKDDEPPGLVDALERAGAAALIVVIVLAAGAGLAGALWEQVAPYARSAIGLVVIALLAAAWVVGPEPEVAEPAGESEQPATGGDAQPDPAPLPHAAEPLEGWAVVRTVRQIATANGWRGAHLDDVLARLPGRSREELLAVLAEAGIPVTEQLKLRLPGGRQRNRQGIRLTALPPAPDEPPAGAPPEPPLPAPDDAAPEPAPRPSPVTVYGTE